MKFSLTFKLDNAAFDECPEQEVSDILNNVRSLAADGRKEGRITDSWGNRIGAWSITED